MVELLNDFIWDKDDPVSYLFVIIYQILSDLLNNLKSKTKKTLFQIKAFELLFVDDSLIAIRIKVYYLECI